jgi:osmotically-inducible protein OsmY
MTRIRVLSGIAAVLLLTTTVSAQADEASDQQITQLVKDKLANKDPQISRRIVVTAHDGVVTLEGTALTLPYMLSAVRDAGSVPGVTKVQNHLGLN